MLGSLITGFCEPKTQERGIKEETNARSLEEPQVRARLQPETLSSFAKLLSGMIEAGGSTGALQLNKGARKPQLDLAPREGEENATGSGICSRCCGSAARPAAPAHGAGLSVREKGFCSHSFHETQLLTTCVSIRSVLPC